MNEYNPLRPFGEPPTDYLPDLSRPVKIFSTGAWIGYFHSGVTSNCPEWQELMDGSIVCYSVDSIDTAASLLTLACPRDKFGRYISREINATEEPELDSLKAFSWRLTNLEEKLAELT